jgi:hypothetical protein
MCPRCLETTATKSGRPLRRCSAFKPLPLAGVQTLYYGLEIIFMLGGVVAADVRSPQGRISKQEAPLVEYKLYVAERYVSKEYLSETKREILDSIRDLAGRIEHP